MSKKAIISLSITLAVIAVILISFWTLFALSSVSVDYKTTTKNLTISNEDIVEAGNFNYGASVLFDGKNKYVERINEMASVNENFAYLEVVNIETVFPNKYVIHVAEREEVFAIKADEKYLICDEDLRILKIEDVFESEKDNPILVENLIIKNENFEIGDFLEVEQNGIKNVYNALLVNNRNLTESCGYIKSLTLGENHVEITDKDYVNMTIKTFSDRTYVINNIDFALENKFQLMFSIDSSIFNQINEEGKLVDKNGNVVCDYVYDEEGNIMYDESGQPVKGKEWTYERLCKGYILIDNFILNDYQETKPTDIYYNLKDFDV